MSAILYLAVLVAQCQGLYIESRRYLVLSEKNIIQLYYGLNKNQNYKSKVISVEMDFEFEGVILSSEIECTPEVSCEFQETEKTKLVYRDQTISVQKVTIFLGLAQLKRNEVVNPAIGRLASLHAYLAVDDTLNKNVLGVSPQSPVYEYFDRIYQFKHDTFRIKMFNFPSFRYVIVNNLQNESFRVFEEQPETVKQFTIKAFASIIDGTGREKMFCGRACVRNYEPQLALRLDTKHYVDLLTAICADAENCNHKSNLFPDWEKVAFTLSYGDQNEPTKNQRVVLFGDDLVEVFENGDIKLLFAPIDTVGPKCDMYLEHLFFESVFISIKYSLNDKKKMIALENINPKQFYYLTPFATVCHTLLVCLYSIIIVYIVYSKKQLKKHVNALSYHQLNFSESLTPKPDKKGEEKKS